MLRPHRLACPGVYGLDRAYDRHVLARMIDFFTIEAVPWPRRLRDIGSLLALEELWEAGAWAAQRVLSPAACDWQRHALQGVVDPNVGLGERASAGTDRACAPRLRRALGPSPFSDRKPIGRALNRLARTLAAHLLDLGYHAATCSRGRNDWATSGQRRPTSWRMRPRSRGRRGSPTGHSYR